MRAARLSCLTTRPLLEPKHPYVVEAVFQDWNDPGNVWSLYSQGLSPLAEVFLPAVLR